MAVAAPTTPFLWGAGGSMKTPEQIAREREIAAALLQGGVDYSPVDHWLQGAARAAQAGVGALKGRWADEAENAGREGFQTRWDEVFGGGAAPVQTASIDPVAAALVGEPKTAIGAANALASVPSGDTAGYIRQGLVGRGLPEHVADAFLMNFQDESGLNPGINEAAPLVPGSRGGYGLYQLTGPRRVAYEQFAQQRGVSADDIDAQLDFLMMELQGPEAKAAQSILSAPDTGTAAAAIVNNFLRPAEEHRARRAAAYTGGAPVRVAQAGGMGGSPDIAALLGLASDPWANDTQRSIINSLVGQQLQRQDPAYQLDLALKQAQLDAALTPAAPKPIEVGGVLLDPVTYQPLFDSRQQGGDPTSAMQNYEYLISQGMAPEQALERAFSGGTTVNVGQGEVGTIPPGYELVTDPATGARRMQLIEGGPAWQEAQAAEAAAQAGDDQTSRYGNVVVEDIGRALELVENDPTFSTGIFGQALKGISGTPANRLENLLNTVRANSAFDRLQSMRAASPTGGALGAVSERELTLLQSAIGSLETGDPKDLAHNLRRLQTIYNEIIHGPQAASPSPAPAPQSTVDPNDIDALLELYK